MLILIKYLFKWDWGLLAQSQSLFEPINYYLTFIILLIIFYFIIKKLLTYHDKHIVDDNLHFVITHLWLSKLLEVR